ncbi:MAG TPA: VWA domain-containing protein, partial [Terriglobia bacterium]|nr:VWA domain-containing protein [Terriglobia bacterium]
MKKFFGLLLIGCFLAGTSAAQTTGKANPSQNSAQNQSQTPVIRVPVDLVNVLFTVVDKKNRLSSNLGKDDFHVTEDGKPQKILFFGRETNLPLRVGILIDTSNSIRLRLHFEQESAIDF